MRLRTALAPFALVAALALGGCTSGAPQTTATDTTAATSTPPAEDALTGTLTIYAAASLKASFDELAADFEDEHPGVDVQPIVYDGSSTLATQLLEGAPADVFASADEKNMDKVAELVADPRLFATNTLVIAVPQGNPAQVEGLADLASVTTVLCAVEVPCGAASQTLLERVGVAVTPASSEQNVTAVLTKVESKDADAGLVYATDAAGSDLVEAIVPPEAAEVVNRYPIAALTGSANPDAAQAFVAFVLGAEGQRVLASYGFGAP